VGRRDPGVSTPFVGTFALWVAAILTLWSMFHYLKLAAPHIGGGAIESQLARDFGLDDGALWEGGGSRDWGRCGPVVRLTGKPPKKYNGRLVPR
jgi:hypothetical protein